MHISLHFLYDFYISFIRGFFYKDYEKISINVNNIIYHLSFSKKGNINDELVDKILATILNDIHNMIEQQIKQQQIESKLITAENMASEIIISIYEEIISKCKLHVKQASITYDFDKLL